MGKVDGLFVKPAKGAPMQPVERARFVARRGVVGDMHAEAESPRQVLIVDRNAEVLAGGTPGAMRENICLDGVAVDTLSSGTVLRVGSAVLRLTFPCDPCALLQRYSGIRPVDAKGLRGMLAVVVEGGEATVGDTVEDQGVRYPTLPRDWRDRVRWFVERLPPGVVTTYGDLAAAAGETPSAARVIPSLVRRMAADGMAVDAVTSAADAGAVPRWRYWEALYDPV